MWGEVVTTGLGLSSLLKTHYRISTQLNFHPLIERLGVLWEQVDWKFGNREV
jgi:hypothetical protein